MERDKVNRKFVLFTSENFPSGGAGATYINLFCKGVKENGGDICVYLFKGYIFKGHKIRKKRKNRTLYDVPYTYLGVPIRSTNKLFKLFEDTFSIFMTFGLMLKLIFRRKKITILVYSNEFLFKIPVYILSKLFFIEIISFVPEFYDKKESKKMGVLKLIQWNLFFLNYRFLNKLSDKLIVFSNFLMNEYIDKGYDGKDIIVQPNLTDVNTWYIPNKPLQFTIGYAGSPSKKDGIFDLICSVKLLKDRGTKINVIIIGDSTGHDSFLPELKGYCKELDISDQIIFKGLLPQEQVKKYLNCCQILAITRPNTKQTQAGFPTKLGEYMGCKKVVLATRFGDIERYFTDKTDIVLAEPDNPASIAESIQWILSNKEKAKQIGEQGFETANSLLDYRKGVKKITDFLN